MIPYEDRTAAEAAGQLAARVRARRLERGWTQAELARRAGVPLGTWKRFEQTGRLAFVDLVRAAFVLDELAGLDAWFAPPPLRTLDPPAPPRRRGRSR